MEMKVTPQTLETALALAYRLGFKHARQKLATQADTFDEGTVDGLRLLFPVLDAAPELLAACRQMIDEHDAGTGSNPGELTWDTLRSSIARAVGQAVHP